MYDKTAPQDPNHLLDSVLAYMGLKNDAALARVLSVAPPILSKLRHHKNRVSAAFLLKLYDATGLSITTLRTLLSKPAEPKE